MSVDCWRGCLNRDQLYPKYADTWDPDQVLNYLNTVPSIQDLSAKELTLRTATLLSLLTGQRRHALHSLKLNDIRFTKDESKCKIFSEKHKSSKPGAHTEPSEILAYVEKPKLCLVKHLKAYFEKTQEHRKSADSKLFLCYTKPFGPVSRNTFSRWVKSVLAKAGIDTGKYTGHSTRAASCSAVAERASLHTVLKAAGWKWESTFAKILQERRASPKPKLWPSAVRPLSWKAVTVGTGVIDSAICSMLGLSCITDALSCYAYGIKLQFFFEQWCFCNLWFIATRGSKVSRDFSWLELDEKYL